MDYRGRPVEGCPEHHTDVQLRFKSDLQIIEINGKLHRIRPQLHADSPSIAFCMQQYACLLEENKYIVQKEMRDYIVYCRDRDNIGTIPCTDYTTKGYASNLHQSSQYEVPVQWRREWIV